MNIFSQKKAERQFKIKVNPDLWTVIIPAAGKGTRLGYSKPKILYPIAGKLILNWLIELFQPRSKKIIIVLSPLNAFFVRPILRNMKCPSVKSVIIKNSRGMADSIYSAVPYIRTPYTLIIWGDQVAISPGTVNIVQQIQQTFPKSGFNLPIVKRNKPYVHYVINKENKLSNVLERRQNNVMPPIGISDCGLFSFNSRHLKKIFQIQLKTGIKLSNHTKEWNFLPMLPMLERGKESINAFEIKSLEEAIGVNNKKDAAILEKYFNKLKK